MNAEVTLSDCHELLNAKFGSTNYQILSFEVRPASAEKLGFMCDHNILKVQVRMCACVTQEENFFIKSLPTNKVQRYMCVETMSYVKEELMFTHIIPMFLKHNVTIIQDCMPHCYLVRPNRFIVFDDLCTAGYRMISARESMTLAEVKVALNSMAIFHASCLILEEKLTTDLTSPYRIYDHFLKDFTESLYSFSLEPCIEYLNASRKTMETQINYSADDTWKIAPHVFNQRAQKVLNDFEGFIQPSKTFRNTMCHGDFWTHNLMFKFKGDEPTDCRLIDFQSYRYCPPAQDIMAFIYLATDNDFRRNHMPESLEHYYDRFGKTLADHQINVNSVISRDEFAESCEYFEIFAVAQAVSHFHNTLITPAKLKEILESPGNADVVFGGDRSGCFLKLCATDEVYKKRNREAIENFRAFCEKIND